MSAESVVAVGIGILMLVGFVVLILLWAVTEELPRAERVPFYERLEPGPWAVRLNRPGRRKARAIRLVNEVIGGDIPAAKWMVEHPPAIIVEGVSEVVARDLVEALTEAGAEAVRFRTDNG